ncbi:MAG: hypothetical protein QMD85_00765 [Candidatus Aenigmarchaeota archaeon]|nr:hypothetical protein [Candidatus Aenigmarchaeota archaeon]MDI6722069.1 hypothetical protein [Candidatus Aenigmarchaeota archaeon]
MVVIPCNDVRDYLENSRNLVERISSSKRSIVKRLFKSKYEDKLAHVVLIQFLIDDLYIEEVKDSAYNVIEDRSFMMPFPPMAFPDEENFTVRRRDYILSDGDDKLAAYIELSKRTLPQTWAHAIHSQEGDRIRVSIFSLKERLQPNIMERAIS